MNQDQLLELGVRPSYLTEYFSPWAIWSRSFDNLASRVQEIDLASHVAANQDHMVFTPNAGGGYFINQGVAIISVIGPMMKYQSSLTSNASTVEIRRQISHALASDEVDSILFHFDSPGGTVSGTADLAQAIAKASLQKPTAAYVEDMAASAAYWCASQCGSIFANNETALVGSIGTYTVLYDLSEAMERDGIKVHVIKAGDMKGAGVAGSPVTDEELADIQRLIDSVNDEFVAGVAEGRGVKLSTVQQWADGRVHPAREAMAMGMIDGVEPIEKVLDYMSTFYDEESLGMTKDNEILATQDDQIDDVGPQPVDTEPLNEDDSLEGLEVDLEDDDQVSRAELGRYMEAFGNDQGSQYFLEGVSFEDASAQHMDQLRAENAKLQKQLKAMADAEPAPVSSSDETAPGKTSKKGFVNNIRFAQPSKN